MNVKQMIDTLTVRLEDAEKVNFSDALKLKALNNAQISLCHKIHYNYLTELQVIETAKATATKVGTSLANITQVGGVVSLTPATPYTNTLTFTPLRGAHGILKVYDATNSLFCNRWDVAQLKRVETLFTDASTYNPLYFVYDGYIAIMDNTTTPSINIYYLRVPNDMIYKPTIAKLVAAADTGFIGDDAQGFSAVDSTYVGAVIYSINKASYHIVSVYTGSTRTFTVTPAATTKFGRNSADSADEADSIYFVSNWWDGLTAIRPDTADPLMWVETCELNTTLHGIVVDLAEAECWAMDNKPDRKQVALDIADLNISTLNSIYQEPEGIGTSGTKQTQQQTA